MSGLRIKAVTEKGLTVLKLEGEFEGMAVLESREKFFEHLAKSKSLAMDFAEIKYIDSAGVALLIDLAKEAADKKIGFGLMNVIDPVRKVLYITKVDKLLKIYS